MNFTTMRSEKLIYFRHYTKTARSAQTVTSVSDIGLVGYTTLCVFLLCSQQTRQKRIGKKLHIGIDNYYIMRRCITRNRCGLFYRCLLPV